MALLGTQLVITLIMVSIIQKLGTHFSFARWILCSTGLYRYLYPTDNELKALAGIQKVNKGSKKSNNHYNGNKDFKTFHFDKSLQIELETAPVVALDVVHLRYYTEFQWLLDFSVYSFVVYVVTELTSTLINSGDEFNLSLLWCSLVVIFAMKILFLLTKQYFEGDETGERSTVIVMGFAYFLLSMIVLIVDESKLELGLETAYQSFNQSASKFLESQGVDSTGVASKIILKFTLAVWCGIVGALFAFPGLRIARMHWDALRYYSQSLKLKLMLNISFVLPFILTLLWIKPVSKDYLTDRVFRGMTEPLLTTEAFDSMRLILIVTAVLLRLILMPYYLQSYLNMAARRVEALRREAGRITNVEFQKKIAAVFYYLCVVSLQFVAPMLLCLFLAFHYKTLGEFSWSGRRIPVEECPSHSDSHSGDVVSEEITLALTSLKEVFTAEFYRGLFGLMTWWSCFAWCSTSFMGFLYQSYFSHL